MPIVTVTDENWVQVAAEALWMEEPGLASGTGAGAGQRYRSRSWPAVPVVGPALQPLHSAAPPFKLASSCVPFCGSIPSMG